MGIGGGADQAPARQIFKRPTVSRSGAIMGARGERFDALDLRLADIGQVGDLVHPNAAKKLLLLFILLAEDGLIAEIRIAAGQDMQCRAFVFPLRAFQMI